MDINWELDRGAGSWICSWKDICRHLHSHIRPFSSVTGDSVQFALYFSAAVSLYYCFPSVTLQTTRRRRRRRIYLDKLFLTLFLEEKKKKEAIMEEQTIWKPVSRHLHTHHTFTFVPSVLFLKTHSRRHSHTHIMISQTFQNLVTVITNSSHVGRVSVFLELKWKDFWWITDNYFF